MWGEAATKQPLKLKKSTPTTTTKPSPTTKKLANMMTNEPQPPITAIHFCKTLP